jgi:hypothetical protein
LRFSRLISCCISFSLILSAAPAPAASAVRSADPDWGAVAGGYPAPGSPAAREELATLHRLQDQRTPADVDRILRESHPDLGLFLDAIGGPDPSDYPATRALLKQAKRDLKPVVAALKDRFRRIRPFQADPTLHPALDPDGSFSFPSKHAALGTLFADLLIRLDPADAEALAGEGRLIAADRVLAGLHWPSDVRAGQHLGEAFARDWLARPDLAWMVQDAAAEWAGPSRKR